MLACDIALFDCGSKQQRDYDVDERERVRAVKSPAFEYCPAGQRVHALDADL